MEPVELLNTTLKSPNLSAFEARSHVKLIVEEFKLKENSYFEKIWDQTIAQAEGLQIDLNSSARQRKVPKRFSDDKQTRGAMCSMCNRLPRPKI